MSIRVSYDPARDCVVTSISGPLDKDVVLEFFTQVGRVASENNCVRILSDLREAYIVASTADIYETASALGDLRMSPTFKRAIVVSRDEDDYAFWETACFNQGFQNIKVFQDYAEAELWVTST